MSASLPLVSERVLGVQALQTALRPAIHGDILPAVGRCLAVGAMMHRRLCGAVQLLLLARRRQLFEVGRPERRGRATGWFKTRAGAAEVWAAGASVSSQHCPRARKRGRGRGRRVVEEGGLGSTGRGGELGEALDGGWEDGYGTAVCASCFSNCDLRSSRCMHGACRDHTYCLANMLRSAARSRKSSAVWAVGGRAGGGGLRRFSGVSVSARCWLRSLDDCWDVSTRGSSLGGRGTAQSHQRSRVDARTWVLLLGEESARLCGATVLPEGGHRYEDTRSLASSLDADPWALDCSHSTQQEIARASSCLEVAFGAKG